MSDNTMAGDIPQPIRRLETALEQARAADDAQKAAETLLALGKAYLESGNVPRALTQFEEGIELAEALPDDAAVEWAAQFWGYKGICLGRLGNSHFAQIALYKAHNLAKEAGHKPLLVDTLLQLGSLLASSGKPEKAVNKFEQALSLALECGDQVRAMHAAGRAATLFSAIEAHKKALEYFALALEKAKALGQVLAAAGYYLNLGNIYLAENEAALAIEQFQRALDAASVGQEHPGERAAITFAALTGLMRAHVADGQRQPALLYGEHALRLAEENGDTASQLTAIHMLAAALLDWEEEGEALAHLQRGLALAREQDDWNWQLSLQAQAGFAAYCTGDNEQALTHYEQALELAARLQDQIAEARLSGRLGAVYAEMGRLREAVTAAEQALAWAENLQETGLLNDPGLLGEQQILLAFTHNDLQQRAAAAEYARAAASSFARAGDEAMQEKAQQLLATILEVGEQTTPVS
ncbi:MAG TPA: tetratricopeptide repeat protein [Candidatus Sulfomarinibacteraceae bacterium]|nr:tetratricopeptide repeat protein [Candidatus Sulfomarinibacteraceae bacterium]